MTSPQPDIIARSAEQARSLPLRALDFQTFTWADCVRQLHESELLVALVKHGESEHTFFRLDAPLHMEVIEATFARSGSASSVTIFAMKVST